MTADDAARDAAVFAPRSVRPSRRPPVLAAVTVLVVATVAGVAFLLGPRGGVPGPSGVDRVVTGVGETATLAPSPAAAPAIGSYMGGPPLIVLDVRLDGDGLLVHGDVNSHGIASVIVSLHDPTGVATEIRSATLMTAGDATGHDTPAVFDLRFDLAAADPPHGFHVEASGYNDIGQRVESRIAPVPATDGLDGSRESGAGYNPRPPPRSTVTLVAPAAGTRITTRTVVVEGRLLTRAAGIEVALVAVDGELVTSTLIDTSNRDGGIRPIRAPSIDVELVIPSPRPIGRLWVVVRAYDDAGTEIGELRRIIDIEPLDTG